MTFEHRPIIPEHVATFLAECVNRAEITSQLEERSDIALLLRAPMPLVGYEAFALTDQQCDSFMALRNGLVAELKSTPGIQQLAVAAAFLATQDAVHIPWSRSGARSLVAETVEAVGTANAGATGGDRSATSTLAATARAVMVAGTCAAGADGTAASAEAESAGAVDIAGARSSGADGKGARPRIGRVQRTDAGQRSGKCGESAWAMRCRALGQCSPFAPAFLASVQCRTVRTTAAMWNAPSSAA